jgi:endonuclease YncB( thermonuclease family)
MALPTICHAWPAKVVSVSDGDTITVLHQGQQAKIRLYGIDAPENGQAFGQQAKDITSALIAGRHVDILKKDTDRYGRIVGLVHVDGQILNESIIQNG